MIRHIFSVSNFHRLSLASLRWRTKHPVQPPSLCTDNNPVENAIRPIAIGRKNWLFAGSETAGQRAANIMTLVQTAKANGHDPHAYLRDVLTRLPSHPNSRIGELLPHTWKPAGA